MKIRQIPASRLGSVQQGRSLSISPQVQLLFGYVDADTTAIRTAIRHFYYGREVSGSDTDKTELELVFGQETTVGTRFGDGVRMRNPDVVGEWNRTLQEIDYTTYCSFFDMNFGNGEVSGAQLCFQLNRRFNAPFGDVSSQPSRKLNAKQIEELKKEISSINREIGSCRAESEQLHHRLEELEGHHVRPYEFENSQKKSLENRIENLKETIAHQRGAACQLEDEIELSLQSAMPANNRSMLNPVGRSNESLAQQVARIDQQIDRWKKVKIDVDGRLTDLKSDLGTARVGDFDSMFDEVRAISRMSESRLLEWMDKLADTDQAHGELEKLIELNHLLCDGLNSIQEYWREDIAKNEIESLNRCSEELDGYLGRLVGKKNRLNGIGLGKSRNSHCQCSSHQRNDHGNLREIEQLKSRLDELLGQIEANEKALKNSRSQLESLNAIPDIQSEIELVRERIRACNHDHSLLQDEKDRLLNQLKESVSESKMNSLLVQSISSYLRALSAKGLDRVFLHEDGHDLVIVDANGATTPFKEIDFVSRNRIRMAVSLACCKLLADSGFQVPLVWEDAFIGCTSDDINLTIDTLKEFGRDVGQVILLTNNQFVKQIFESQKIPSLDIPDRYSGYPVTAPSRESDRRYSYSTSTDWIDVNRRFDLAAMDQYGNESSWHESAMTDYSRQDVRVNSSQSRKNDSSSSKESSEAGRSSFRKRVTNDTRTVSRSTDQHKFYLELASRVEAAPTIGPKTAERLEKIGVCTVSDLLNGDAHEIAGELANRRIKPDDVKEWQKQARLVCQVPNLRGHDAQLLVACGIHDASQLSEMDPISLYEVIGPFAKSKDGKKLLRGATQPDLEEVRNWVNWSRHQRECKVAA